MRSGMPSLSRRQCHALKGPWLIFEDGDGVAKRLATRLEMAGGRCIRIAPDGAQPPRCPRCGASIVHLRSPDLKAFDADGDDVEKTTSSEVSLDPFKTGGGCSVMIVTRGAQRVTGSGNRHQLCTARSRRMGLQ